MNPIRAGYAAAYIAVSILFAVSAVVLVVLAAIELWPAMRPGEGAEVRDRFGMVLEVIGMLTIAVAALELSQSVLEEEVQRGAHLSSPTRVRRFLSRFLLVIVVSSAIEFLIAIFDLLHRDPARLPHAAAIGVGCAALLVAWGAFVRWNRGAERLEPEALDHVKSEDHKVDHAGHDAGRS